MNFTTITHPADYVCGDRKMGAFPFPFAALKAVLGEPFRNDPIRKNRDYPDDCDKTDVCWCIQADDGSYLTVWNYKNGPAYNDEGAIEDIDNFSVWFTNLELYGQISQQIADVARQERARHQSA